MTAAREGQGGLIAMSVPEVDRLIGWARTSEISWTAEDAALRERLREWRSRHTEATA